MSRIYFIDSENVSESWIELFDFSQENDSFIIFYTPHTPNMSYESVDRLRLSKFHLEFIKCETGKNGLDFQLCSELGYRLNNIGKDEFYIISNDTGYEAVVRYWKKKGYFVRRLPVKFFKSLKNRRAGEEQAEPP